MMHFSIASNGRAVIVLLISCLVLLNLYQFFLLFDRSITNSYTDASIGRYKYYQETTDPLINAFVSKMSASEFENFINQQKRELDSKKVSYIYKDENEKQIGQILVGPLVFVKENNFYRLKTE